MPSPEAVTDSDDDFIADMEALKRACQLTGHNSTDGAAGAGGATSSSEAESDEDGNKDLQLVRSIQDRFAVDEEDESMVPLCTLPPEWSDDDDVDCEDDYETLRAIQRRFAAYSEGGLKDNMEDILYMPVQVGANNIDSEKESSNSFVERTNVREGFLNCVDTGKKAATCDDAGGRPSSDLIEWNEHGVDDVPEFPLKSSHFPKSALAFVDAIKKNRSSQKHIRSKMIQMESRMEELKKLMERVKVLKDFQVACKKRTGRALSQKKDACVQLISLPKPKANIKLNDKKIPAMSKGPPENLHVANYKEALATFSVSVNRDKWSKKEGENLVKGVKQQFQGMLLQRSVDLISEADEFYDSNSIDGIMASIKDFDITPEKIRLFLPKVDWEQLATMYVPGRSGAECQARFLNCEDPLINHNPWTAIEDKNLLHSVQQRGLSNWIDIAASLGTNRTPFQCLARYQRSLNASILKREWTKEDDCQLRSAVETYGESNWQVVASVMEGRTGTQCSNRWMKTLHPARKRVGKWTADEDKRLKVAVTLFGPKTWKKVASCVPGRTQVQCRERWVNCLDPSRNTANWTEEEDLKLEMAIQEHGYCWSKVAACVPRRTDNQCLRRWRVLFPHEVPMLQEARKIQKAALISNFVDRESERPALGPKDFHLPETYRITESENVDPSCVKKRRPRRREAHNCIGKDAVSGEICPEEVRRLTNDIEAANLQGRPMPKKGKGKSPHFTDNPSSPCTDAVPDTSNGINTRKSRVHAGSRKRKRRKSKKRSSVKSNSVDCAPTSGAICEENVVVESQSEEYRHPVPIQKCSNLTSAELGGICATTSGKASKLHPRRNRGKMLEAVPDIVSDVDIQSGQAAFLKTKNKKKKQTDATNNYISFPDSMSLKDIREGVEAVRGTNAMKRKRESQETCSDSEHVSSAVDGPDVDSTPADNQTQTVADAVSCDLEDSTLFFERDNDRQDNGNAVVLSEIEEENDTLASFLDRTQFSSAKIGKSQNNGMKKFQAQLGTIYATVPNQHEGRRKRDGTSSSQMVGVETGSRNGDKAFQNEASDVEAGDDTTLAQFFNKLKRRTRT